MQQASVERVGAADTMLSLMFESCDRSGCWLPSEEFLVRKNSVKMKLPLDEK